MRTITLAVLLVFACAADSPGPAPEPVQWQVCYSSDGVVTDYEGDCSEPQAIVWQLPVMVYIDDNYPRPELALQVLFWWNDVVGVKLFDVTLDVNDAVVYLHSNNLTMPPGAGGFALHWIHPLYGRLFIVNVMSLQTDDPSTLAHEFGHVLGLAHDPVGGTSVMEPEPYQADFEVSPSDLLYLKQLYAK
jgi:hypothetical protein